MKNEDENSIDYYKYMEEMDTKRYPSGIQLPVRCGSKGDMRTKKKVSATFFP